MGIIFALSAMVAWGIGDFLIQKSARRFGSMLALFYVCLFTTIFLFPFVFLDIVKIIREPSSVNWWWLLSAGVVVLGAATCDFLALRRGKLSVVEPILAGEVLVTALLSQLLIGEYLTPEQFFWALVLILGIFLVSTRSFQQLKKIKIEAGVWLGVVAMVGMGAVNVFMGEGARQTSPLFFNWWIGFILLLPLMIYLFFQHRQKLIPKHWRGDRKLILAVGFFDTTAWVAFTAAALYMPIALATAFSESYIALAAALGIYLNKEKLAPHQGWGIGVVIIAAIMLALTV